MRMHPTLMKLTLALALALALSHTAATRSERISEIVAVRTTLQRPLTPSRYIVAH
jgi:hypothetical protein